MIVPLLVPLKAEVDEFIYTKGSHPSSIFFLTKGRVSFVLDRADDLSYKDMLTGAYFGEIEIIKKCTRMFTVKATLPSDFLTLQKAVFENYIEGEYKEIFAEMVFIAERRLEKIKMAKK